MRPLYLKLALIALTVTWPYLILGYIASGIVGGLFLFHVAAGVLYASNVIALLLAAALPAWWLRKKLMTLLPQNLTLLASAVFLVLSPVAFGGSVFLGTVVAVYLHIPLIIFILVQFVSVFVIAFAPAALLALVRRPQ